MNVTISQQGSAHIKATSNNIIITITNQQGQVVAWSSAGKRFKGSKKRTPYAARIATEECAKTAYDKGMRKIKIYVKGPGKGREAAIRAIQEIGMQVSEIRDITPIPHNGCRQPKITKK